MCGTLRRQGIARGLVVLVGLGGWALGADDSATLREVSPTGRALRVEVLLKAEGTRPNFPARREAAKAVAKSAQDTAPEGMPFRVTTRLEWSERVRETDPQGRPKRVLRRVDRAEGTIDVFRDYGQKMTVGLRPELALLLADRRDESIVVASLGGPLTREELDLVQTASDPLALADLLPEHPVSVGATWQVSAAAARALCEYETLTSNGLSAKLVALDETTARIELSGTVTGGARGAEGSVAVAGELIFDRKAALVKRLRLERAESRPAGPVESALNVKSVLVVERTPVEVPMELSDAALQDLPIDDEPERRELLMLSPPGGAYTLQYDRRWHLVQDSVRRVVLRRLDQGRLVAQCDLIVGPSAGRGRHQDLGQFRDDVQKALGERFGQIVGEGEVGGAPGGGFRYKLGVEGKPEKEGDAAPLWYYYLIASPEGEQLIAVFTLNRAVETQFAEQDQRLIGSLEWVAGPNAGASPR